MRARFALGAAIALALLPVAVPAARASAEEPARLAIGTVLPLTGSQAAFGAEATRGIEVAAQQLLARDPELASHITIVVGDDQSTAQGAGAAATKLIEKDHVRLLLGSVASWTTTAVAGIAQQHQLPMIAPISSQALPEEDKRIFRTSLDEGREGELLATYALKVLGVKQAATLREDGIGEAAALVTHFAAAFKAGGGQIVAEVTYALGTDDFAPALKQLADAGAKLVVTPASYLTAQALLATAKKLHPDMHFLGGDGWDTPALASATQGGAVGSAFVTHFAADDTNPAVQAFVLAFRQKYGRAPGAVAALSFDAYNVAIAAFQRAHTSLAGPLTSALAHLTGFTGVTGTLTLAGGLAKEGIVKSVTASGNQFKTRVAPRAGTALIVPPPGNTVPAAAPTDASLSLSLASPPAKAAAPAAAPAPAAKPTSGAPVPAKVP